LLRVVAEDCDLSGPSSDNHEYSYNADDEQAVLRLNIANCGLDEIYHETRLRSSNEYYMAAANVTLGVHDDENDRDLIFYNAYLGAECGEKVEYTVRFNYQQKIDTHDETECHEHTPDGQCIVAAFTTYNFLFREYAGSEYDALAADDVVHRANEMIYLQIESTDLPDHLKFAVKKCDFVDTVRPEGCDNESCEETERYPMFNAENGVCTNRYIELAFGYDYDGAFEQVTDMSDLSAKISHRLFLLSQGDQDSYALECDVKVCNRDDHDSDCNKWTSCLDADQVGYVCEDACSVDQTCSVSADVAVCT